MLQPVPHPQSHDPHPFVFPLLGSVDGNYIRLRAVGGEEAERWMRVINLYCLPGEGASSPKQPPTEPNPLPPAEALSPTHGALLARLVEAEARAEKAEARAEQLASFIDWMASRPLPEACPRCHFVLQPLEPHAALVNPPQPRKADVTADAPPPSDAVATAAVADLPEPPKDPAEVMLEWYREHGPKMGTSPLADTSLAPPPKPPLDLAANQPGLSKSLPAHPPHAAARSALMTQKTASSSPVNQRTVAPKLLRARTARIAGAAATAMGISSKQPASHDSQVRPDSRWLSAAMADLSGRQTDEEGEMSPLPARSEGARAQPGRGGVAGATHGSAAGAAAASAPEVARPAPSAARANGEASGGGGASVGKAPRRLLRSLSASASALGGGLFGKERQAARDAAAAERQQGLAVQTRQTRQATAHEPPHVREPPSGRPEWARDLQPQMVILPGLGIPPTWAADKGERRPGTAYASVADDAAVVQTPPQNPPQTPPQTPERKGRRLVRSTSLTLWGRSSKPAASTPVREATAASAAAVEPVSATEPASGSSRPARHVRQRIRRQAEGASGGAGPAHAVGDD